jgi:microcystin-dependent protein
MADGPDSADDYGLIPSASTAQVGQGGHPAWWALGALALTAVGGWLLYASLEADVARHAVGGAGLPAGAIVAFASGDGKCPEKWREATELRGRFLIGAGQGTGLENKPYGQPGGAETVALKAENLPPHRHQVVSSAGETIGTGAGVPAADGGDETPAHSVRAGLTGEGVGPGGERLAAAPVKVMPPYLAYTFCRAGE